MRVLARGIEDARNLAIAVDSRLCSTWAALDWRR
jgi:hypothetical protein